MLRLLIESLEKLIGPALGGVASIVYFAGLAILGLAVALPLWRLWLSYATARAGVARGWTATCPHCGETAPLAGTSCVRCSAALRLPLAVRLLARAGRWPQGAWIRRLVFAYRVAGIAAFLGLVAWMTASAGVLAPRGALHRLLLGLSLLALAAFGRSAGRALGVGRRSPVARAGEGLQALAAVGVLAIALFLAAQARPPEEAVLARFTVAETGKAAAGRLTPSSEGEGGLEYLQLEHRTLGYTKVVPLALVGASRLSLPSSATQRWLVRRLRRNVDGWAARGLTVRVRRDVRQVAAGVTYEAVVSDGQVTIRKAAAGAR